MPLNPRASVLIAVLDRERYLPQAIESALAQTCADFELLIWDDGSRDRSLAIARDYAARDPRVRVVGGEHLGVNGAMRALVEASTAPLIGFLDSDDLLERRALAETMAVLDADPEVGVVYTDYVTIDEAGKSLGYGERCRVPYSPDRLLVEFMTFQFRLMRKTAYLAAGASIRRSSTPPTTISACASPRRWPSRTCPCRSISIGCTAGPSPRRGAKRRAPTRTGR